MGAKELHSMDLSQSDRRLMHGARVGSFEVQTRPGTRKLVELGDVLM